MDGSQHALRANEIRKYTQAEYAQATSCACMGVLVIHDFSGLEEKCVACARFEAAGSRGVGRFGQARIHGQAGMEDMRERAQGKKWQGSSVKILKVNEEMKTT
eukprot:2886951-Pleurochrysis_carterae.AAC.1